MVWAWTGPSSWSWVIWRKQVEIVQKVLHHVLCATMAQGAGHLRKAREGWGHFGSWARARVYHVHVGVSQVILLRHEGWKTAADRAGIGAGARTERCPGVQVIIAVWVGAAGPLAILGTRAFSTSIRTTLKGQLHEIRALNPLILASIQKKKFNVCSRSKNNSWTYTLKTPLHTSGFFGLGVQKPVLFKNITSVGDQIRDTPQCKVKMCEGIHGLSNTGTWSHRI